MDGQLWRIERYDETKNREWDEFVENSRNSTFLFKRGYMDYHSDRFRDYSWMAYKKNRLLMMLPANIAEGGTMYSHQGLTYGGWILPHAHVDAEDLCDVFRIGMDAWRQEGVNELIYKTVPYIYASQPSQDDEYALMTLGAEVVSVGLSSTIDMRRGFAPNQLQRRHLAKTRNMRLRIEESDDVGTFMTVLNACLLERHGVMPVHTAAEMELLKMRFPDNIRLFVAGLSDSSGIEAGVMMYDTGNVAHCQYIATTSVGREMNLLAPLFDYLANEVFRTRRYFDFGTSNERDGRLNGGLLRQKSSFGATGVAYTCYRLRL